MSPSFVRYVLKFKKDDSAFGDVARDIQMDPGVNRNWGYRTFKAYLMDRNASCLDVVDNLYERYSVIQGNLYKLKKTQG
jgi:hypothetical protein